MTEQKRKSGYHVVKCPFCYRPIRYKSSAQLVEGRATYYDCDCDDLLIRVIRKDYDPKENTKGDK